MLQRPETSHEQEEKVKEVIKEPTNPTEVTAKEFEIQENKSVNFL